MTHREHVSKEQAAAFQARIVELEAELAQATTRAEAAEQDAGEMRSWVEKVGARLSGGVEMRPVRLFRVQDSDRPLYVVAGDWAEALQAWRRVIAAENEGLSELENPQGIEFVASERELLLSARDIDQVVR